MMKKHVLLLIVILTLFFPFAAALGGDEGWIEIRCNVDGASVLFDGSYKGMINGGSLTVPVYTTAAPYHTVTVEKSGYTTYYGSLAMPAAGQTTTVYATLNPTQVNYGSIYVESSPSGAEIYFNGDYRGLAPVTIGDVWPGRYTISAEKDGYHTYTTTTSVSSGTRSNVYCPLSPLNNAGSLYVLSDPSGANIYLDAAYKGKTPMTIGNIAGGTHILEVDHAGYHDWKSTVEVPSGGTRTISATLSPVPASTTGWIYVTSSPGGASVALDNNLVGQTPASGSLKLNNIGVGSHTVSLTLPGYSAYTTQVSISPSTVTEVNAILTSSAPALATGALSVSSTPAGANVFIDNNFVGITPLEINAVSAGMHTVTIRMEGFNEYSITTPVNAGATSTVAAALTQGTAPTQKSGLHILVVMAALALVGAVICRRTR